MEERIFLITHTGRNQNLCQPFMAAYNTNFGLVRLLEIVILYTSNTSNFLRKVPTSVISNRVLHRHVITLVRPLYEQLASTII